MPIYVVTYHYTADTASLRAAYREQHLNWLKNLDEFEQVFAAGIYTDTTGGLLILEASSRIKLEEDLDSDPFARNELIEKTEVKEWSPNWGVIPKLLRMGT